MNPKVVLAKHLSCFGKIILISKVAQDEVNTGLCNYGI